MAEWCSCVTFLPSDMQNPGYLTQQSAQMIAEVGRYITPHEWGQLALGANASIQRHHWSKKWHITCPLYLTLGLCFCPLVYDACEYSGRVDRDVAKLPITQQLKERGITVRWIPKSKLDIGGMEFTLPAGAVPVQQGVPVVQGVQMTPVAGQSIQRR